MLTESAQTGFVMVLCLFLAMIAFKLLAGQINTRGLLADKETGAFSPGRLQLLVVTMGGASFYLSEIIGAADTGKLPVAPIELLLVVGASNAGYLGGKIYSKFFQR